MNAHVLVLLALVVMAVGCSTLAEKGRTAVDPLTEPVILVATETPITRGYAKKVVLVTPLSSGRHFGFILNYPVGMAIGEKYSAQGPTKKIYSLMYLGGPVLKDEIFLSARREESPGGNSFMLAKDIFFITEYTVAEKFIDEEITRISAAGGTKNWDEALRFMKGFVAWRPGELKHELGLGAWHVIGADPELVFRTPTDGLSEELAQKAERRVPDRSKRLTF